jgi:hypothetical protein
LLRAAATLARRKVGLRTTLRVVPLDPSCVRGTHGLLSRTVDEGPMLICSDGSQARENYAATEVKELLLRLAAG